MILLWQGDLLGSPDTVSTLKNITNGHFIHASPLKGTGVSIYLFIYLLLWQLWLLYLQRVSRFISRKPSIPCFFLKVKRNNNELMAPLHIPLPLVAIWMGQGKAIVHGVLTCAVTVELCLIYVKDVEWWTSTRHIKNLNVGQTFGVVGPSMHPLTIIVKGLCFFERFSTFLSNSESQLQIAFSNTP